MGAPTRQGNEQTSTSSIIINLFFWQIGVDFLVGLGRCNVVNMCSQLYFAMNVIR